MANQKHLDLQQRILIEIGLNQRESFKKIAKETGKDCTTIAKEVKLRRVIRQIGGFGKKFNDCANRYHCPVTGLCLEKCKRSRPSHCSGCVMCNNKCSNYKKEVCPRLSLPPYVCNGCVEKSRCTLEKFFYVAKEAQNEYEEVRSESRSGRNFTESELRQLDQVISPLIKNGQSVHHICVHHADQIMCSERTVYSLIDDGILAARNIDLPRKVRLKPRKGKKQRYKVDKKCRINRTLEDYHAFIAEHPDMPVTELDSVEGIKGGACLLTVHSVSCKLQMSFKREANDSQSVIDIFNNLYDTLGRETYMKLFSLLLADNGSEFSNPKALEFDKDGKRRSWVFYCDPAAPEQKGACENNHTFIRRIIRKGVDIGRYTDDDIRLMMDHINSYSRPDLGDKAPYDVFAFFYGQEVVDKLGLTRIPSDKIVLTPDLLKKDRSGSDNDTQAAPAAGQ